MADAPDPLSLTERLPLGVDALDAVLGGGLRADGLHEAYAAAPADAPSAAGFALLLAHRKRTPDGRALIWAREARLSALPHGPGLVDLGLDPDAVTLLRLPDGKAVLRAGLDSVRSAAAGAVVIELHGKQPLLDLTASRRLALAAADTGTLVLIVRSATDPAPSAAHTRWQVASAPSRPLEANAPGHPAFALTLLRQRGGRGGLELVLEWDRETICFLPRVIRADATSLSGVVPAVATGGTGAARGTRAA